MDLSFWKKLLFMILPTSTTWSGTISRNFTILIQAIASVPKIVHDEVGKIFTDLIPSTTRRIDDWSKQFNHATVLSTSRLESEWKQGTGQSPNFFQQKLHDAGFTQLYVHEWWRDESDPLYPSPRDPTSLISEFQPANLLVNPVSSAYEEVPQLEDDYQLEMDTVADGDGQLGDSNGIYYQDKLYTHNEDEDEYPSYFYVCGQTFPQAAAIDGEDYDEIRKIIYKHKPAHLRCVLIVTYDTVINTPTSGDEIWINTPTTGTPILINIGS